MAVIIEAIPAVDARAQVERVLQSRIFRSSEVLKHLFGYLADQSLAGTGDSLKEYTIGIDAFGKPSDYDPRLDSTVRIQIGRLRQRLSEYYRDEGKDDPLVVDLPKGRFGLVCESRPTGFASAALAYPFRLAPHASQRIGLVVPLSGPAATPTVDPTPDGRTQSAWLEREERSVAAAWKQKLNRVGLRVPRQAQPLVDTLRTALAHLLITRDGPILRPGTRSYARSWIRDGTMISGTPAST